MDEFFDDLDLERLEKLVKFFVKSVDNYSLFLKPLPLKRDIIVALLNDNGIAKTIKY
jgi:hypothetical protein